MEIGKEYQLELEIFLPSYSWPPRAPRSLKNRIIQWEMGEDGNEEGSVLRSRKRNAERSFMIHPFNEWHKNRKLLDSSPFPLPLPATMPGVNNIIVTIIARGNRKLIYFWMWWFEWNSFDIWIELLECTMFVYSHLGAVKFSDALSVEEKNRWTRGKIVSSSHLSRI